MFKVYKTYGVNVIESIAKFLFKYIGRINESIRIFIVFCCAFLLQAIYFFEIGYFEKTTNTMIYGSVLTFLVAIISIKGEIKKVSWNIGIYGWIILFAIGMLIISTIHEVGDGYIVYAIDLLFILPLFYFVQINNKGIIIARTLSIAALTEGLIAFFMCMIMAINGSLKIMGIRVMGYTRNPNFLGALGLIMFISGLYLLRCFKHRRTHTVIISMTIGAGLAFMLVSSSRAALASAAGCTVSYAIFSLKQGERNKDGVGSYQYRIIAIMVIVITAAIGIQMDDINYNAQQRKTLEAVQHEEQDQKVITENSQQQGTSEKEKLQQRLSTERDINTFTSGRLGIWQIYIKNFSLLGKERNEIADSFEGYSEWRAHNNIIDYIFRLGYVVGGFYLMFYVSAGISGIKMLFSRRHTRPEEFLAVEIIGAYACYSLIEVATLPFNRCVPCMFFLLISPIAGRINYCDKI